MGTVSHLDNADNDKSLLSSVTSCGVGALQLKVVQLKIQEILYAPKGHRRRDNLCAPLLKVQWRIRRIESALPLELAFFSLFHMQTASR